MSVGSCVVFSVNSKLIVVTLADKVRERVCCTLFREETSMRCANYLVSNGGLELT